MNKIIVILLLASLPAWAYSQHVGVKSNMLYDATTTLNLGFEVAFSKKITLDVSGNYNPWKFGNKYWKHWMVQPELRYWFCESFNGHFLGVEGHYADFNVQNLKLPFGLYKGLRDHRYQGKLYGGGFTYGYQWILSNHWGLEASLGVGYARIDYDRYECGKCGEKLNSGHKNYFGPTKVALSIIYLIK